MRHILVFWALLFPCYAVFGQTGISLIDQSPFLPPSRAQSGGSATEENKNTKLARLQLRGITSIDGEYIFSVYNPDTREGKWIPQGVEEDGLLIRSYDADSNSVIIFSESENLSRQLQVNDYAKPSPIQTATNLRSSRPTSRQQQQAPGTSAARTNGILTRTAQAVQRPTRRNLETLRARRAELAEKLRKQSEPIGGSGPNQSAKRD